MLFAEHFLKCHYNHWCPWHIRSFFSWVYLNSVQAGEYKKKNAWWNYICIYQDMLCFMSFFPALFFPPPQSASRAFLNLSINCLLLKKPTWLPQLNFFLIFLSFFFFFFFFKYSLWMLCLVSLLPAILFFS